MKCKSNHNIHSGIRIIQIYNKFQIQWCKMNYYNNEIILRLRGSRICKISNPIFILICNQTTQILSQDYQQTTCKVMIIMLSLTLHRSRILWMFIQLHLYMKVNTIGLKVIYNNLDILINFHSKALYLWNLRTKTLQSSKIFIPNSKHSTLCIRCSNNYNKAISTQWIQLTCWVIILFHMAKIQTKCYIKTKWFKIRAKFHIINHRVITWVRYLTHSWRKKL